MAALIFLVPEETARILQELEVPEGSRETHAHITVVHLGDDVSVEAVAELLPVVNAIASQTAPFTVEASRVTTFPAGEDGVPVIVPLESPELHAFREALVKALDAAGIEYSKKFPEFKPHVTLTYAADPGTEIEATFPPVTWTCGELHLWGSNQGDGRLTVKFPLNLPKGESMGRSFASAVKEGLRTVLETCGFRTRRTVRLTEWLPVAQVEDDTAPFPEDQRLYADRMEMLVRNFNPKKYRPPVILGTRAKGPAHLVGEWDEPVGHVAAIDFDGLHTWARIAEIVDPPGRVEEAVSAGHLGRSVGYWIAKAGADGGFMLRHLALLAGEPEGQMDLGLPPLSRYFRDALGADEGVRADTEPFNSSRVLGLRATLAEEEEAMKPEELEGLLDKFAQRTQDATDKAVKAAVEPLAAKLDAANTEITTLKGDIEAARSEAKEQAKATRTASFRSELQQLVSAGKVAPAEVETELETLEALTAERATKRLDMLKAREPVFTVRALVEVPVEDGKVELVGIDPQTPLGMDVNIEAAALAIRAERSLPADKRDDPDAFLKAMKRLSPTPPWGAN